MPILIMLCQNSLLPCVYLTSSDHAEKTLCFRACLFQFASANVRTRVGNFGCKANMICILIKHRLSDILKICEWHLIVWYDSHTIHETERLSLLWVNTFILLKNMQFNSMSYEQWTFTQCTQVPFTIEN